MKTVQLRTICNWVNETTAVTKLGFSATLEKSWTNTDRDIPGTRLRHPGKGRDGWKLRVYRRAITATMLCFEHDSSGTYRRNDEALRHLESTLAVVKAAGCMPKEWRGR